MTKETDQVDLDRRLKQARQSALDEIARVWLPDGTAELAAVSPELETIEGAWWIREESVDSPLPIQGEGLLPCPFCGSRNLSISDELDEDANWVVWCVSCKGGSTFCEQKADAIEHWNTRAEVVELAAQAVEQIQKAWYWKDKDRQTADALREAAARLREGVIKAAPTQPDAVDSDSRAQLDKRMFPIQERRSGEVK